MVPAGVQTVVVYTYSFFYFDLLFDLVQLTSSKMGLDIRHFIFIRYCIPCKIYSTSYSLETCRVDGSYFIGVAASLKVFGIVFARRHIFLIAYCTTLGRGEFIRLMFEAASVSFEEIGDQAEIIRQTDLSGQSGTQPRAWV